MCLSSINLRIFLVEVIMGIHLKSVILLSKHEYPFWLKFSGWRAQCSVSLERDSSVVRVVAYVAVFHNNRWRPAKENYVASESLISFTHSAQSQNCSKACQLQPLRRASPKAGLLESIYFGQLSNSTPVLRGCGKTTHRQYPTEQRQKQVIQAEDWAR